MLKSREKSIKFSYRFSKTITLHLCQKSQCVDYPRFTIFCPFLPNARQASKSAILQIVQFYTIFRIARGSPVQRGGYLLNPAAHQPAVKSPRAPRSAARTPLGAQPAPPRRGRLRQSRGTPWGRILHHSSH